MPDESPDPTRRPRYRSPAAQDPTCRPRSRLPPRIPPAAPDPARRSFASVSYTDWNIGRILDAFEATRYGREAMVALWGDHGWHLGDNNQWDKMTNFE